MSVHLVALRRLSVEPFSEQQMVSLGHLEELVRDGCIDQCLLAPDAGLVDWPLLSLEPGAARRFTHGNPLAGAGAGITPGPVRVYGPGELLLGLGEVTAEGNLRARRLMNLAFPETPPDGDK